MDKVNEYSDAEQVIRKAKAKAASESSQRSAQLQFAIWIAGQGDYTTKDGLIYKFVGTHWQVQDQKEIEKIAFNWLAKNAQDKATDKISISCVQSAIMYLPSLNCINSNIVKIPVQNGTIHAEIEGTSLHASSSGDGLTYCLSCDYNENARAPMFMDFLTTSLPNADVRNYLQEYIGYTLISDTRHQFALWLIGNGGNGKGTFSEIVAALHSKKQVASLKIGVGQLQGFNLSALIGASLVVVDETPARIDEQSIKTLISGDLTTADRKFRDVVSFRPTAKWLLCGNNMPSFSDQSDGVWRRFAVVPFDVKPAEPTPLLAGSIIKSELSGVLNWALEGLGRLLGRGKFMPLPELMRMRKEQAKLENDSVNAWFDDVEPTMASGKDGGMSRQIIYTSYVTFCARNGLKSVSSIKFWQRLHAMLPELVQFLRGEKRTRCANMLVPKDESF